MMCGDFPRRAQADAVLALEVQRRDGQFSSDGRFVAYVSDESGRSEVYVREFAAKAGGGKRLVSTAGGTHPRWRADKKELFYFSPDGTIMAVDVTAGGGFRQARPNHPSRWRPA